MKLKKVQYNPFADCPELQMSIATTESQREILSSIRLNPDANLCFNESISLYMNGIVDQLALKNAVQKVVSRHSVLRATISADYKHLIIPKDQKIDFQIIDLLKFSNLEQNNKIENYISEETSVLFDLIKGPLIRFKLLLLSENKSILIMSAHHLVCDGWSSAEILDDLGFYYNQYKAGDNGEREFPFQYWEYALELEKKVDHLESQKRYWVDLYKDSVPQLNLPIDNKRNEERTFNSKRYDHKIPEDLVKDIRMFSRKSGVNFYTTLYAAYLVLLEKLSGDQDIAVGISAAAQSILGKKSLVGHCVNLLPIRNIILPEEHVSSFLKRVSNNILDAVDHQEFTFGSLLKELPLDRDLSRIPLVSVIFNIDLQPVGQGLNFEDLNCHYVTNPRHFENFEMFINATVCGDKVIIENQYNTSLFSEHTISSWMQSYQDILQQFTMLADVSLNSLDVELFIPKFKDEVTIKDTNDFVYEYTDIAFSHISDLASNLLCLESIEPKDNFFHLGGHSLLAGELMVELRTKYGYELTLKDIFNATSFAQLASLCSKDNKDTEYIESIQKVELNNGSSPLSVQQFRVWYVQTLNPDATLFNLPSFRKLGKKLNVKAFQKSLNEFIVRHPLLNVNIVMNASNPQLKINKKKIDLNVKKEYKSEVKLMEAIKNRTSKAIDLNTGYLFLPEIYQTSDGEFYLCMFIHHIIWDGWCYDLFQEEMTSLYKKNLGIKVDTLPDVNLNYFDYIDWQKNLVTSEVILKQKNYWIKALQGQLPILDLPIDFKRPPVIDYTGESYFMKWEESEILKLEEYAHKYNTTLFNVLFTALNVLLHKYTGDTDFIIGMPVQGRHWSELSSMVGFFASNIAVRTELDINSSFSRNLLKVKEQISSAYSNSDIPFDNIVRELDLPRDPSRTPVYQCFFMYQDATNRKVGMHDLSYETVPIERGACHTDLDFWARRDPDGMAGGFDFMTSLFRRETIERIALDFREILKNLSLDKESIINENSYLSPINLERLLNTYNDTSFVNPNKATVHSLFEQQVVKHSKKICVSDGTRSLTYGELNQKSNQLARNLIERGVSQKDLVGVAVKRSVDLFISIFGIWKAGAGYVPLDPDFPKDRLFYMIDHSQLKVIVTNKEYSTENIFKSLRKVIIDDIDLNSYDTENLNLDYCKNNTCYIIYTSGSTGKPKGVQVGQDSVVNFLLSMNKKPGMSEEDILCAITTLSFDISVLELYLPLISGASLVIVDRDTAIFGDQLAKVLKEKKVTMMQATPASWRLLLDSGWKGDQSFKILCGGEPFPKDLAQTLLKDCASVWNMYGPTETTVWSTCKKLSLDDTTVFVGRPIHNTLIYVLDDNLNPVPQGVTGNLFIGGDGLALGYLNRQDLTDEKFIPSPFIDGETIYDTGDLVRYNFDGDLECLGRNDGQVKVRGYRIELGEIESILANYPGVKEQVVIVREDRPGDVRLVSYYISDNQIPVSHLREYLQSKLPNYMIPSHFVKMDKFPMTLNEKIDRKNLPPINGESKILGDIGKEEVQVFTPVEKSLHSIWCELLSIPSINIDDDFFDIGGHSLLSVELFGKIFELYSINLPLSSLFDNGTIRLLAKLIQKETGMTLDVDIPIEAKELPQSDNLVMKYNSLVLMRAGSGGEPVFFFHGVGGNVLNYRILFKSIPSDRPIYGLQSLGIDGTSKLSTSFMDMVQEYALEIMSLTYDGPYTFIGGSMGGLLAFEVAKYLKQQGEIIDKLIMLDTFGPNYIRTGNNSKRPLATRLVNACRYRYINCSKKLAMIYYKLVGGVIPHELRFFFVELNNFKLMRMHKVNNYDDHLIMIRGRMSETGRSADPNLGWLGIVESLDVHYTDADHDDIVECKDTRVILAEILNK